jgi:hypothetical protein
MRSTYPYDNNNDFYDNDSDEESATSTIDSRQSPSTELLEAHYSSSTLLQDSNVEQQQGKVNAVCTVREFFFLYLLVPFSCICM